jgi:hypothetical protein
MAAPVAPSPEARAAFLGVHDRPGDAAARIAAIALAAANSATNAAT